MKVSTDSILLGALCEANNAKHILDIGTGCGILSLMMAQKSKAIITAIDVDGASIEEANDNFKRSSWYDRLQAIKVDLGTFSEQSSITYDLIVTNPPYFDQSVTSPDRRRNVARNANLLTFETLAAIVKRLLAPNGDFWIVLPVSEFQKFSLTATYHLFSCLQRINICHHADEFPVLVVSHWRHTTNESVHRIRTMAVYDRENQFSEDFKAATSDFYPQF